jgi:hypothetical protein
MFVLLIAVGWRFSPGRADEFNDLGWVRAERKLQVRRSGLGNVVDAVDMSSVVIRNTIRRI